MVATLVACGGASGPPAADVDDSALMNEALDRIYACGLEAADSLGLEIARADEAGRIYISAWEVEGRARRRVMFMTRVHERYGPGADAIVSRDAWQVPGAVPSGAEAIPESRGGWERQPGTTDDAALATSITDHVLTCWEAATGAEG